MIICFKNLEEIGRLEEPIPNEPTISDLEEILDESYVLDRSGGGQIYVVESKDWDFKHNLLE